MTALDVLSVLVDGPATKAALVETTEHTPPAVKWALEKLQEAKLVEAAGFGPRKVNTGNAPLLYGLSKRVLQRVKDGQ